MMTRYFGLPFLLLTCAALGAQPAAKRELSPQGYIDFVRTEAAKLRGIEQPPATLAEWERQRAALRVRIEQAWGGFPAAPCPLQARTLGTVSRDGYRIERIVFETRPGVSMTANAYVPDKPGRHPAVLAVHGHWPIAKQDPGLQPLHLGLVKLGFFVLAVDAFGAGERGVNVTLADYHGEMTAATLWPVGLALSGLQVYENMRAVDYLLTRGEVDPARIGITGASGGGNQSMFAGAWDNRFAATVPVCSVGNFQAYLGDKCCMCEVVPGALHFMEEWGVLGLTAPRPLMVISATQESIPFSVGEAKKSIALAQRVFDLHGRSAALKHLVIEDKHGYSQPMREAMYGWVTLHLKGKGDGSPLAEPAGAPEDSESLRCYPGDSRPHDFLTIPKFAAQEAQKILQERRPPSSAPAWQREGESRRQALTRILGRVPAEAPLQVSTAPTRDGKVRQITYQSETGIALTVRHQAAGGPAKGLAILLDVDGPEPAEKSELAAVLRRSGWSLALPELRGTGRYDWARNRVLSAVDHSTAQWGIWIGRPLVGQWVLDVRRALDALQEDLGKVPQEIIVIGIGPAGVLAMSVAALDLRISGAVTVGSLASYITTVPYKGQRMAIMVPGILREVGDIQHLAAMIAPRRLIVAGGVNGAGDTLNLAALEDHFAFTRKVYALGTKPDFFSIGTELSPEHLLRQLGQ